MVCSFITALLDLFVFSPHMFVAFRHLVILAFVLHSLQIGSSIKTIQMFNIIEFFFFHFLRRHFRFFLLIHAPDSFRSFVFRFERCRVSRSVCQLSKYVYKLCVCKCVFHVEQWTSINGFGSVRLQNSQTGRSFLTRFQRNVCLFNAIYVTLMALRMKR